VIRGLWRLLRAVLHGAHGVLIVLLRFPALDRAGRHQRIAWWSAKMLRMLGLQLQVQGTFQPGAKLIVANHVSWLDIVAVHAICPEARFVSKADVQRWPLVGRLVAAGGTLYLERERRRDALRVVHQMAEVLTQGGTVAAFPEGTTGDGHALLPFHANLLQAAIATSTAIQPVALRYADAQHAVSPAAQWLGDTTLAASVWKLACARGLVVRLQVLSPAASAQADRRTLAAQVRQQIEQALA
jgi:1-acyl-sn-glycerol-3-phosphate acyltransferase